MPADARIRTPRDGRWPGQVLGATCFAAYLVWNGYWLTRGQFPPSVLKTVCHLPAPTTGMTRSLMALMGGHVQQSLCWNPFAVPIVLLCVLSWTWAGSRALRGTDIVLPRPMVWCWLVVLPLAWGAKFVLGRQWW